MRDLSKRSLGQWGEDRAAVRYRMLGFEVVARNWRSPARSLPGELDVVARSGDLIVFCEVKTRRTAGYGGAALAVDAAKQSRLRAVAELWLRAEGLTDVDVRFDVITVEGVRLTHYEAAF